jgi:hypothetical protein
MSELYPRYSVITVDEHDFRVHLGNQKASNSASLPSQKRLSVRHLHAV